MYIITHVAVGPARVADKVVEVYIYISIYLYLYLYLSISIYLYVYMYVYIYMFICRYITNVAVWPARVADKVVEVVFRKGRRKEQNGYILPVYVTYSRGIF